MHGDLSGGNILLTSGTQNAHGFSAKVSDFGLARDLDVLSKIQTKTTGTVTHMAPEVHPDTHTCFLTDARLTGTSACGSPLMRSARSRPRPAPRHDHGARGAAQVYVSLARLATWIFVILF